MPLKHFHYLKKCGIFLQAIDLPVPICDDNFVLSLFQKSLQLGHYVDK